MEQDDQDEVVLPVRKQGPHLDSFLAELKREQVGSSTGTLDGRKRYAQESQGSREHVSGPVSTNLFVGGLPATLTEQGLARIFAECGPVARVKILWPRSNEHQMASSVLNGFVSFMKERDAKKALEHFDGFQLEGHKLRLDWGKPIPLPQKAMVDLSSESGRPGARRASPRRGRDRESVRTPSPETTHVIHAMVDQVRQYGPQFEQTIKQKQGANPRFRFLVAKHSNEYHYYQSCLDPDYTRTRSSPSPFSSAESSSESDGSEKYYSTDSEEASEQEKAKRGTLGRLARKRLIRLLRSLTTKRSSIARAMAFAVERTEQLESIIDVISTSLTRTATPLERKIARLYLVSDIINTSWRSHAKFKTILPAVFQHLNTIYRSFPSRLKAEQFRAKIEPVLVAFENQIVFDGEYVAALGKTLVSTGAAEATDQAVPGLSVVASTAIPEDIDGEPMSESEV